MALLVLVFFFFQAEDGIRDSSVTGVQTCALPISELPEYDCNLLSPVGILISERVRHTRLGEYLCSPFVTLDLDWRVDGFPSRKLSGENSLERTLPRQTPHCPYPRRNKQQEDHAILSHPGLY